jgi:hypothetical protein
MNGVNTGERSSREPGLVCIIRCPSCDVSIKRFHVQGLVLEALQAKIFAELRNRLEIERNTIRSWILVRD